MNCAISPLLCLNALHDTQIPALIRMVATSRHRHYGDFVVERFCLKFKG
jgi:hypothetical protein